MRKLCAFLAIVLALSLMTACGAVDTVKDPGKFALNEPSFVGNDSKGNPQFELSWTKAKNSDWYEIYIFSQIDNCTHRSRVTKNDENCLITLLDFSNAYDTDTASYRIKVRPRYSGNDLWSSVWQIDFANGEYTVTPNAEDFEKPIEKPQSAPQNKLTPLPHEFPETLIQYEARCSGAEDIDLSDVAMLTVVVNHCEYGEPVQMITDPDVVFAALAAAENMTVTGQHDNISSTATYYGFSFCDADGKSICSFSFQNGLLMENDGRYSVTGLQALTDIDGIKLDEGWENYWENFSADAQAYEENLKYSESSTVFDLDGYGAHLFAENIDNSELLSVSVRGDEYRGLQSFRSSDPEIIRALFGALKEARLTGKTDDKTDGQEWRVSFDYILPGENFVSSVTMKFVGNTFISGTGEFSVDGLDAFFASAEGEVMEDLRSNRTILIPAPKY